MRSSTITLITATCVIFATFFCPRPSLCLTRDEVRGLAFLAHNSRSRTVQGAFTLLIEQGIMKVRPEKQWELAGLYPRASHPDVAEAILTLQEAKILNTRPINWKGTDNAVEILVDDNEIYTRALAMINRAKKTCYFNVFLWGGSIGDKMVEAFAAARDRGVDVKIITPGPSANAKILQAVQKISNKIVGGKPLPKYKPAVQKALDAKLPMAEYPTKKLNGKAFVKADHNKLLTVDGNEALTGGMNFADTIRNNHDLMLWIAGPAVQELERTFADNWRTCRKMGGENLGAPQRWSDDRILDAAVAKGGRDLATVVVTNSNAFINATRGLVEQLIDNSKTKIRVMMFTFTDDRVVKKVIAAHERGVDVKILLDPNVHAFGLRLMGAPNISSVRQFKKAGIPVRVYKTQPGNQMHIKACMVDDFSCCFGSTNWTKAGFDSNVETYVRVDSPHTAGDFEALFDIDWADNTYELKTDGVGSWILSNLAEVLDNGF